MIQYFIVANCSCIVYKESVQRPLHELPSFFNPKDLDRAAKALKEHNDRSYPAWDGISYDGTGPDQRRSAELSDKAYTEAIAAQAARKASSRTIPTEGMTILNDVQHMDTDAAEPLSMLTIPYAADVYIAPILAPQPAELTH